MSSAAELVAIIERRAIDWGGDVYVQGALRIEAYYRRQWGEVEWLVNRAGVLREAVAPAIEQERKASRKRKAKA